MSRAMRSAPALALALLWLAPAAQASSAPQEPNTQIQRGKLAVRAVQQSLVGWTKPGVKMKVRPAIVPFGGSASNPITGAGPVEVFVEQELSPQRGFLRNLVARFNPYAKQKYLVHVGEDGETEILERTSLAPHRRVARFLAEKLPLRTLFVDFFNSKRASEGMWTLAGASGSAFVNPYLSGALFMRLATVVRDGIQTQREARRSAIDELVKEARQGKATTGRWMNLRQAYGRYAQLVDEKHEGARPLGLGEFAHALSFRQL